MSSGTFFCAASSRANGELLYGTVAHIESWLLLEHPGFWRPHAIEHSPVLSTEVKDYLGLLHRRGTFDRMLLIRREHRRTESLRAFFVHSCETPPRMTEAIFTKYEELSSLPDKGEVVEGLMYAVCTHGRHDKCCAKFGLPVYRALRDVVGRRAWECSHVGGDRFAGNIVVFPYGLYYGHVGLQDVHEIVRSSERGEVWLKCYRGRSCFPRAVQVAEYFARSETGRMAIDEFRQVEVTRDANDLSRVRLRARSDASIHTVVYATRRDQLRECVTCAATEATAVPQHELISYQVA